MTTTSNTTFQPTFGRKVIDRLDEFIEKRRKSKLPRIRRTKLTSKRAGHRRRVKGIPKATRRHHHHKRVKKSFLESLGDFLSKAYRPGLVRTKVKVKRGGKTFERWQWVRPDEIDTESSIDWANNNLNYENETRHMAEELDSIRDKASIGSVSGERTDENKNTVSNNISGYLSNFEEHLDAVTYNRVNSSARSLIDSLWTARGDHSAKDVQDLTRDSVDKLLYQEASSWERQLGDHGVRHINGNINRCTQILGQLEKVEHNVTDREKLMAQIMMINHDLGYTSEYCRQGIKQTKKHKEMSVAMFRKQRDLFSRFFNDEELEQMENFILVHDAPFIDWKKEPLLSTITVSDNLSLYQSEKLPPLFRFVKDGVDILSDMQKAYRGKDEKEFKKLKDRLFSSIDSAKLPKFTKKMLKKAAMTVGPLTAKFMAPVIVGDLDDVKYDSEKGLSVSVKYNEYENKLRGLFEMGQSKMHSFFKDYGVDASNKTEISIPGKLSVNIKGFAKKSLDVMKSEQPDPYSIETYDWVDKTIEKAGLPIPGKHPHGSKQIGKQIESNLYSSLKKRIEDFLNTVPSDAPQHRVLHDVMEVTDTWKREKRDEIKEAFNDLYVRGLSAGIVDAGVEPTVGVADKLAMQFLKTSPHRIGDRITTFSEDLIEKFRNIIANSYTAEGEFSVNELVNKMKKEVPAQRYKLERIARTETAAVSNAGRIIGWDKDPDKYYFDYHWNNTVDNRTKPISIWRGKQNPLTFDEIKFLWENQGQWINGKYSCDTFNQRCSCSRSPSDEEKKGNRWEGDMSFEKTMNLGI